MSQVTGQCWLDGRVQRQSICVTNQSQFTAQATTCVLAHRQPPNINIRCAYVISFGPQGALDQTHQHGARPPADLLQVASFATNQKNTPPKKDVNSRMIAANGSSRRHFKPEPDQK